FELDVEPKTQIAPEGDRWRSVELTPLVEYYPVHWLDLVGEGAVARTRQFEQVDTWEVTPRLGFRVNLVCHPVKLATLCRWAYRSTSYSDGSPASHQWRFRARLEVRAGINREDMSRDGTLYGTGDLEVYVPLGSDVSERYASKLRSRVGLGFR